MGIIHRIFPHGLLAELLAGLGYTDVQTKDVGKNTYRVVICGGNEPALESHVEQQLTDIVERLDQAQWRVELCVAVVNGQQIAVKIKVRDIHMGH